MKAGNFIPLAVLTHCVAALVCAAAQPDELIAPSGEFGVRADVPAAEVSPSFRFRVRLVFFERTSKQEFPIFTGASGEWAIAWAPGNVLVLFATQNEDDVPVHAFEAQKGRIVPRHATEAEKAIVRQAYEKKYPKKPG